MSNESDHEHYEVLLISREAEEKGIGRFSLDPDDETCTLELTFSGRRLVATGTDYFEALCRIRDELELNDIFPKCYGASRNCFPSGMARSMGAALKVYKLELGVAGSTHNLVGLFDTGDDVSSTSVADQAHFYQSWLDSLGRTSTP